jgi:hypothetical protein
VVGVTEDGLPFLTVEQIPPKSKVIYCYTPYETADAEGNFVFKCGFSKNFDSRVAHFHSDFFGGVYILEILIFKVEDVKQSKWQSMTKLLRQAEKETFKILRRNGAQRLRSTTRKVREVTKDGGMTEWFYGNMDTISQSFHELQTWCQVGDLREYLFVPQLNLDTIRENEKRGKKYFIGQYAIEIK